MVWFAFGVYVSKVFVFIFHEDNMKQYRKHHRPLRDEDFIASLFVLLVVRVENPVKGSCSKLLH